MSTPEAQPLVVIDLDGTLMRCNTFSRFTLWVWQLLMRRGRWGTAARIARTVARRKLRRLSHAAAKHEILAAARGALRREDWSWFASTLRGQIRPEVAALIESGRYVTLLATAAPQEYAVAVGRQTGVDAVIATQWTPDPSDYCECRGEEKLRRVKAFAQGRGLEVEGVLTDHHDDLPLLQAYNGKGVLVHPSRKSRKIVEEAGVRLSPKVPASGVPSRREAP